MNDAAAILEVQLYTIAYQWLLLHPECTRMTIDIELNPEDVRSVRATKTLVPAPEVPKKKPRKRRT